MEKKITDLKNLRVNVVNGFLNFETNTEYKQPKQEDSPELYFAKFDLNNFKSFLKNWETLLLLTKESLKSFIDDFDIIKDVFNLSLNEHVEEMDKLIKNFSNRITKRIVFKKDNFECYYHLLRGFVTDFNSLGRDILTSYELETGNYYESYGNDVFLTAFVDFKTIFNSGFTCEYTLEELLCILKENYNIGAFAGTYYDGCTIDEKDIIETTKMLNDEQN